MLECRQRRSSSFDDVILLDPDAPELPPRLELDSLSLEKQDPPPVYYEINELYK